MKAVFFGNSFGNLKVFPMVKKSYRKMVKLLPQVHRLVFLGELRQEA